MIINQDTLQITSPPKPCFFAWAAAIIPFDVEIIVIPRPRLNLFNSLLPTYTLTPSLDILLRLSL